MGDALVAVGEGMVLDEGEREGGRLVHDGRVKILTAEAGERLCNRGLERAEIPDTGCTTRLLKEPLVQRQDLCEREVTHGL